MLESGTRNGSSTKVLDRLGEAVAEALDSGVSEEELTSMVTTAVASYQSDFPGFPETDEDVIYRVLPDGLIDLPSASGKYDIQAATLRSWVRKGHVKLRGRLKGPAIGGGFLVVNEAELVAYITGPRSTGGRPRKYPQRTYYG